MQLTETNRVGVSVLRAMLGDKYSISLGFIHEETEADRE